VSILHRWVCSYCPWWFAFTFDNPVRRLFHSPLRLLAPWVRPGMKVLDLGCGMGYFTLGLARLVGPEGRVYAIDIQRRMLDLTLRRARRAGLAERVTPTLVAPGDLSSAPTADFALAFWMVHEVPGPEAFFAQLRSRIRPGGRLLIAEPRLHVTGRAFDATLDAAYRSGWSSGERLQIALSRARVLSRT
jgi:2-polyprenyl-3-methyl-5-hydroxy-6-metoxy-1,4-benzoquinol methylase